MNRIIAGLITTLLPCAALAQKPSTAADQVPIEEYAPKVIIEGKWGTGPGEFGVYDEPWNSTAFSPSSLAVDSKGSIYVLDHVNDRIQKFTSAGKFSKIIPVEGFSGNRRNEDVTFFVDRDNTDVNVSPDHPRKVEIKKKAEIIEPDFKTVGINIVIDSRDNLYYYLKRTKDGKESGEVWHFRNDKLVKKTVVPVTNMLSYGVGLDLDREDDSLWIPDVDKKQRGRHYQFRTGKILDTEEVRRQKSAFKATEAGKKAAARPRPKYYLDIETSSNGIRVIEKLN